MHPATARWGGSAYAGARAEGRLVLEIERLNEQDFLSFVTLLLLRRDNVADDASDDHISLSM